MSEPMLSPGANLSSVRLRDEQGSEIGQVKEWIMDVDKGQVVYVLAQFQNSDKLTAIPWEKMISEKEKGGYRVGLSPDEMSRAPQVSRDRLSDIIDDKEFLNKVFDSFGSEKYWSNAKSNNPDHITQRENIELSEGKGYDYPLPPQE